MRAAALVAVCMTEAQARAAPRAFVAIGEIERWIAEQPWEPAPDDGWTVPADLHGWRFRLEPRRRRRPRRPVTRAGRGPAEWTVPGVNKAAVYGRHEHGIRTARESGRRAKLAGCGRSYAAAVAAFHCAAASARKRRSVRREIRWRCRLKVL